MIGDQTIIGLILCFLALGVSCGLVGYRIGRREAQRAYTAQITRLEGILRTSPHIGSWAS